MGKNKLNNTSIKKDALVTLKIEDIGTGGEGIGKVDGFTLFVKDTVIGDVIEAKVIKVKKNYGYGRLLRVVKASPDRVQAKCPVARQCGGCQIQEMDYAAQLTFKRKLVKDNLERIGGLKDISVEPVIGMEEPFHFRNKAQFPVGKDKNGNVVTGFYAGRTHHIVENMDCCIGAEGNEKILFVVKQYMQQQNIEPYSEENHTGVVRHILIRNGYHTGEVMVCLVINSENIKTLKNINALTDELCRLPGMTSVMANFNTEKTNVILGKTSVVLWGQPFIEDFIGNVKYQISPQSFFQVNPAQTEKLYGVALEYADLTGNETVWDLYCGIGTISLFLAQKAKKVYGVEIVPQAIDDARENAKRNGFDNTEFFVGKAEEIVPQIYREAQKKAASDSSAAECINPDVVVVDPPRKGCDEVLLDTIIKMNPKRIVYVSCDSATLARDLKYLTANGYEVQKVQPVDQFGHSVHVETVVLLTQNLA
jgi:23S rRNA (uracil1939-C5)-methyltransferase